MTGNFYDATFRGEISLEDDEPAGRLERRVEFADNFLRWRFLGACGFLGEGASSDGETIAAEQSSFNQALCDERSAACCVEIGCDKTSSGFEIGNNGNFGADAVEIVNRERELCFVGDGQQMQNGICRAAG